MCWSIKESGDVLSKLKSRGFRATSLSTYDFSTLYTTLPHIFAYFLLFFLLLEVKSMQRSGTEAIRTQIQPSKPKREITNFTNSQNIKRTYGQQSEQLFPKRWPFSNRNRTKNKMNTQNVKRHGHRNSEKLGNNGDAL